MNPKKYELAVIGGGAAGFAAAVTASRLGCSVLLLEKQPRVTRKLAATGNGRCNFTNENIADCRYHGKEPVFQHYANTRFDAESNIAFFRSLGVMAITEEKGKVFPLSLQASAVVDLLRAEADRNGVTVYTDTEVIKITGQKGDFTLCTKDRNFCAEKVIVATGGMASPELGGSLCGYQLLEALGHTVTPLAPALVKLKTENRLTNALKGLKVEGVLILKQKGKEVFSEAGEILFTEYGISGPPVLACSRLLCYENAADFTAEIDLLPQFSEAEVFSLLKERRTLFRNSNAELFLTGLVMKKIGQLLMKDVLGCKLSRLVGTFSDGELKVVANALKGVSLAVKGTLGWKQAQVTVGGVATAEFSAETMESKIVPGMYAVGEVLDIDGDCGGFNLQWAWASGRLAAEAAVKG